MHEIVTYRQHRPSQMDTTRSRRINIHGLALIFTAWFSEMITVHYGAKLVDIFDPTSEFIDSWEAPEHAECEKESIRSV